MNDTYVPVTLIKDCQKHIAKPLELVFPLLGPSNTDIYISEVCFMKSGYKQSNEKNAPSIMNENMDSDPFTMTSMTNVPTHELGSGPQYTDEGREDDAIEHVNFAFNDRKSLLTNDGATFLIELSRMFHGSLDGIVLLKELSCCMDQVGGDGTTGVVCLVRQLLMNLKQREESNRVGLNRIFKKNDIRDAITNITNLDGGILADVLDRATVKDWDREKSMEVLVQTTLSSKISSFTMPTMIDLSIAAIKCTNGKYEGGTPFKNRKNIEIVKQIGDTVTQSRMIHHSVWLKVENIDNHSFKVPFRCIALQCSLNLPQTFKKTIDTIEEVDRIIREETTFATRIVGVLRKNKINMVLLQENHKESLPNSITRLFKKFNIQIVVVRRSEIEFLLYSLKCGQTFAPITNIRQLQQLNTSNSSKFVFDVIKAELYNVENVQFLNLQSPQLQENASILLYGSSKSAVDEMERALHDGLKVLEIFYLDPRLVYGGGCSEMIMSSYLQYDEYSIKCKKYTPNIAVTMRAIGESFEIIPSLLSQNCGLNSAAFLDKLRKAHANQNFHCGLSVNIHGEASFGSYKDTNAPPVELLHNKKAQILMALETAWQLAKIDEIMKWKV